ncbi:MAG TPA: HAMP domain-containing sensor histidine kinase [Thermoanaerobaculia bacterium]|nr:HAMP domain-containing sensor histidine kinase [Thermoanaerobaculia bacterium]
MSTLYATLLDRLSMPVAVVTATGDIAYRNSAFDQAFGGDGDDWLRSAAVTLGGERGWLHGFFAQDQEHHTVEIELNGRMFRIEKVMADPLDVPSAALILEDVTLHAEAEQAKSDFTSMIVHDLRGPLSGIQAALEFVLSESQRFGPMHEDLLKEASLESTRMMGLISEILDFSKIQSGRFEVEYQTVMLPSILKRSIKSLQVVAGRDGVQLFSAHGSDLPAIEGSPEKLTQAIINLISNALKFTPSGGVVSVGCQVIPEAVKPDHVVITVTDTGVGIAEDELGKIFDRYEQSATRSVRGESGTGLGLYIVQEIVEAHGGTLDVASVPGLGTSMVMRLPIHQPTWQLGENLPG